MKALTLTAEMALAAILGNKTETRRPLNPQPPMGTRHVNTQASVVHWYAPFGLPGTELWLREPGRVAARTHQYDAPGLFDIQFAAGGVKHRVGLPDRLLRGGQPPSWWVAGRGIPNGIFREAARFKTVVIEVRVERLQQISRESIRAEGFTLPPSPRFTPGEFSELHQEFAHTWNRIYGKRPGLAWADNPCVSVTKFRPMDAT